MAVGGILGVLLKLLVDRARPAFPEPVAHASGYSFPSGHALNSMLGVGVLLLVFLPVLRGTGRIIAYVAGAAVVLLTGYDRVALGVHYVSDVLAGWVVALACPGRHRDRVRGLAPRAGPPTVRGVRRRRPGGGRRDERPALTRTDLSRPYAPPAGAAFGPAAESRSRP